MTYGFGKSISTLTHSIFFRLQWLIAAQPIIQVLLIIVSCVLAWGEAWFLDCRVIPQEKNAQRFYRALMVPFIFRLGCSAFITAWCVWFQSDSEQDERSPLLGPYLSAVRSHLGGTETSIANFYSPIESAHNSEEEDDQVNWIEYTRIFPRSETKRCETYFDSFVVRRFPRGWCWER